MRREVTAVNRLNEDTAVLSPSGAHVHRVIRAVHTVVTPGRFDRSNLTQQPPEIAMSDEDLCQAVCEDSVTFLQHSPKRGLTAKIVACLTVFACNLKVRYNNLLQLKKYSLLKPTKPMFLSR